LALGTAALAGCGSPVVSQYRLAAMPGNLRDLGQLSVSVRSITIPGYLDQNAILKPGSAYQVNRFGNAVWAEPLADMLQAVLVADLSQRLGGGNVFASGTIGQPADKVVEVAVQRFDFDPDGELNLTAQLAVKTAAGTAWVTQSFQQLATPAGADAADIAASMSGMWGGAADKLAAMLQAG
jgi:uncharacterized lipoprotein YmbA